MNSLFHFYSQPFSFFFCEGRWMCRLGFETRCQWGGKLQRWATAAEGAELRGSWKCSLQRLLADFAASLHVFFLQH
ncbi:hypothetical protein ILYODFUR_011848 [Ilyodon furcidens]|uniref:Uncharacterized protein n=1 Tax=Ilyodon furcidens TaxID=33524 RepID=A0ABV0VD70_9TELE